jgi:hypothetical protein
MDGSAAAVRVAAVACDVAVGGLKLRRDRPRMAVVTGIRVVAGTVTRWLADAGGGVVDSPDLEDSCRVDAAVIRDSGALLLRVGQPVEVEWAEPGPTGYRYRAVRVTPQPDLQDSPGA